jgi:orotidine-5'-phosphate decarboxylase
MISFFPKRIAKAADDKNSRIILALDPPAGRQNLCNFAEKTISSVQQYICAIKMNFHLILPLSTFEISRINLFAHSYGLQSIADIKLNDIQSTNEVVIEHLVRMGFDAVIANPFMGIAGMKSLVHKAHESNVGAIALVYMSHAGASEGFGLAIEENSHHRRPLYKIFLERASEAGADGIVVGATQLDILRQVAGQDLPVYSPGIGAQGGDIENAVKNGADYLIIGRSIIEAEQPAKITKEIQRRILAVSK